MTASVVPFRRGEQRDLSDEALVIACASGEAWALDRLFRRHGAQVHRVLVRLRYVDSGDLDDVVQLTFLEAYRAAKRFRGRAAVSTWILGIAMNVMRHHVRGDVRRRSAMSDVATVSLTVDERRPDEHASQRESLESLRVGLDALPRAFQIVFTLCDLEGLKGADVAGALGIPEGTVWRRLHEARTRLRACIDKGIRR
jgi:RNA polymerase sigma-70 factor (ECF subfamily)